MRGTPVGGWSPVRVCVCACRLLECEKAFPQVRTIPAASQSPPREGGGRQRGSGRYRPPCDTELAVFDWAPHNLASLRALRDQIPTEVLPSWFSLNWVPSAPRTPSRSGRSSSLKPHHRRTLDLILQEGSVFFGASVHLARRSWGRKARSFRPFQGEIGRSLRVVHLGRSTCHAISGRGD